MHLLRTLRTVPTTTPTSTNLGNTGSDKVNTGFETVTTGNVEAISLSATHEEEVFSDADDDEMPEVRIYDQSSKGIHNDHPQSQILGDPNTPVQTRSSIKKITGAHALKVSEAFEDESGIEAIARRTVVDSEASTSLDLLILPNGAKDYGGEEVYVSQPPGFVNPDHPKKVYKVVKALYGLHQAPRAWYDTLSTFLEKHGYRRGKTKLACGIEESPLDLVAYSDSDYAAANLDRKSTTGGCQFLRRRLISWQCKKQTIVATSTTMRCIVAAAQCYGFRCMNPVYHSKTKHIEIRHHFIRDCYEKKLIQVQKIHTDLNVADLLTKPFDGPSLKEGADQLGHEIGMQLSLAKWMQIGCTVYCDKISIGFSYSNLLKALVTQNSGISPQKFNIEMGLNSLKDLLILLLTITEESVRRQLQLADDSGITMLQNEEIFEGLQNIGSKNGGWDQFGSNIATALICLSTGRAFNFSKLIFDGMISNLKSKSKFLMYPRFLQMILNIETENKNLFVSVLLTKKIFGNMKRGFQGIHRPLLPAMLTITAGQAQSSGAPTPSQPVPSTTPPDVSTPTPPPIQTPTPSTQSPPLTQPVPSPTPPPIPTPTPPPISTPKSPPPPPETEPTIDEHIYEEQPPVHHHFSPSQAQAPSHMSMDDLLQTVPKLISRIDSLEEDLKQTKLTMGNAIVKLVKKVKKLEGFIQRRNLVLIDSEEEEPEAQGISVQGLVTPPTTKVNTLGEEQVEEISPNTLEAAKTLSKVASLKSRSIDKGRRYKRRGETKDKKVVSSLDFQEEFDTGAEKVSAVDEEVNTASEINTGSIKVNTVKKSSTEQQMNKKLKSVEGLSIDIEDWGLIRSQLEANAVLVNQRKKFFAEKELKLRGNSPCTITAEDVYDELLKESMHLEE
ncbi:putative ribonuclease H-like domain-containing protein [Tanacetum coccineum]